MINIIKAVLFTIVVSTVLLLPQSQIVTIDKNDITENRPFAGVINGDIVGTKLCCYYGFSYDEDLPNTVTYNIIKPLVFQYLGYVYSTEILHVGA